jgi:hypothetical protein
LDLLQAADLILWDEFWSNNKEIFESAINFINEGTTIVVMGDPRQILPIVQHGGHSATIEATFTSSRYWETFTQFSLTKNMRLLSMFQTINSSTPKEDRDKYYSEVQYANLIQKIGEGKTPGNNCIDQYQYSTYTNTYLYQYISYQY